MEIREERAGDALVVAPDGDLRTAEDCHALEQRLNGVLAGGARFLVVDCAKVGHLTSPALRALLLASRKLTRVGGRLVLCGMPPKVQKAFSISGFDHDFTVVATRDAAVHLVLQPLPSAGGAKPGRKRTAEPVRVSDEAPPAPVAVAPPAAVDVGAASAPVASVAASGPAAEESPRASAPALAPAPQPPVTAGPPPSAAVPPPAPDPRSLLADRLLSALGGQMRDASVRSGAPPNRAAALDSTAAALLRALDVRPA
jgi:anti-anti-sigma factor